MWGIALHNSSEVGLARQIFLSLKERILTGQIPQGEALPSTRELAKDLGVSRNTVCDAYDMLWTEGFIVSHQGTPSRVADGLQIQTAQNQENVQKTSKSHPVILWDFGTAGFIAFSMAGVEEDHRRRGGQPIRPTTGIQRAKGV